MSAVATEKKLLDAGLADLPDGGRRIVDAGTTSIGVFHVGGSYYGLKNSCPHELAELCRGKLTGTTLQVDKPGQYEWGREGHVLRCPWHGWEFDLDTGRHLANESCRVKTYRVEERDGRLFVEL
jgi:nitrite reductase/ring-hydroxylating ferredoxin subunit